MKTRTYPRLVVAKRPGMYGGLPPWVLEYVTSMDQVPYQWGRYATAGGAWSEAALVMRVQVAPAEGGEN